MNIYEKLGIKTIINASDCYTRIGGSRMDSRVLEAIIEASKYFVDINLLQKRVGNRIAELTKNEDAFVTSGAAAGMVLSAAACMTMEYPKLMKLLPNTTSFPKNEFIIFKSQCLDNNPYWHLVELSGGLVKKIKPSIDILKSTINKKTAGIYYFAGDLYEKNTPPIKEIIGIAKSENIPVIIDAAAQLPPIGNMWYYTNELGADLIVFSGGKFIKGPQSTGLILGKRNLIEACRENSNPNVMIGRPFKVGKEEIMAMLTALEIFINSDHSKIKEEFDRTLDYIEKNICSLPNIKIKKIRKSHHGQEFPLLVIKLPKDKNNLDCFKFFSSGDTPVDIGYYQYGDPTLIYINPINLARGELDIVISMIKKYFRNS